MKSMINNRLTHLLEREFIRASDVNPVKVKSVLLKDQNFKSRDRMITTFFREKTGGFTYEKFKSDIQEGIGENRSGLRDTRARMLLDTLGHTEGKDGTTEYEEYVETFFMYLYYEIFVKLFLKQKEIISKNQTSIKEAKSMLSKFYSEGNESLKESVEEAFLNMYKSFYAMFMMNTDNLKNIETEPDTRKNFMFNFFNENVQLFEKRPISSYMTGLSFDGVESFVDSMFKAIGEIDQQGSMGKQVSCLMQMKDLIRNVDVDFDVERFSKISSQISGIYINFPEKSKGTIDSIMDLMSKSDLKESGLQWAEATVWEPYVRILTSLICVEEISDQAKKKADALRKSEDSYKQKIDVGEQDGGIYFINNIAFLEALKSFQELKEVNKHLDNEIGKVFKKCQYFQDADISTTALLNALFYKYDSTSRMSDINEMDKNHKESLEKIMKITGLNPQLGGDFNSIVSDINYIFFSEENNVPGGLGQNNQLAIKYAMDNVGDSIIKPVKKSEFSFLKPDEILQGAKEIATSTLDAISQTWNDITAGKLPDLVSIYDETFGKHLNYSKMVKVAEGQYEIKINDKTLLKISSMKDFSDYVSSMILSSGSMLYHAKVSFGQEGSKDSRYDSYFNVLSWFIRTLKEYNKSASVKGSQFKLTYLVTPFLLDVIKYSVRTFVNNIDAESSPVPMSGDLRKKLRDSYNKSLMSDEEWKPIADELKNAIVEYLQSEFNYKPIQQNKQTA